MKVGHLNASEAKEPVRTKVAGYVIAMGDQQTLVRLNKRGGWNGSKA